MEILPGVDLNEDLLAAFVAAGRKGYEIALAHHADPGSNGFTFGNDRYHRSCEMIEEELRIHGFTTHHKGAALRANGPGVKLRFATAKSPDITTPSSFDMTTPSRLEAGWKNHPLTPQFEGLAELLPPEPKIIHVVWSGDSRQGLTAVHIGHLVALDEHRVQWDGLARIDSSEWVTDSKKRIESAVVPYTQQEEPDLELSSIHHEEQEGKQSDGTEK